MKNKVREDLKEFAQSLPENVVLVAASKYAGVKEIKYMMENGITNFGENRVDAFIRKYRRLSKYHLTWHFIGHLQRNKARPVINRISYLHSLDSVELAYMIEKYRRGTKPVNCFIEVSINEEINKNGLKPGEVDDFIYQVRRLKKVKIVGLMMMAKADSTHQDLLAQFGRLRLLKEYLEERFKMKIPYLSMGMSDDYPEAIQSGATHIRLGRILYKAYANKKASNIGK